MDAFSTSSLITRTNNDVMQIRLKIDHLNLVMREKLTGVRVIRAFGTTDFKTKRFDEINSDYKRLNRRMQRTTNSVMPVLTVIWSATAALVMLMAAKQFVNKGVDYTIGEVMAIIQYIMQIMMAVIMLTMVSIMLPRAATAAERSEEVLSTTSVIANPQTPAVPSEKKGYLIFENVSFTYAGASVPAIKDLSFEAKPGEVTAIIGDTGMGKSTIVNLIPRLYDVTEGRVLVDGIDVREYDLAMLREKIGFVPQKALLFAGTIESNLAFGDSSANEDRIEEAVRIAQSYDFIMKKDEGFESPIAQGGTNVSGGQRQRLCIARAVVRRPEIYVLDDSFSALDFKTDKALRAALSEETEEATVVIVAQRINTIMDADRIIVVENGDILEVGNHETLMAKDGLYAKLYNSQFSEQQ